MNIIFKKNGNTSDYLIKYLINQLFFLWKRINLQKFQK